ncbi:MAG: tyrosine--tRNA ligase [Candidatus Komeilibacteria bacterium]
MKKQPIDRQAVEDVIYDLARTTDEIFSLAELKKLLASGRQLRIKYGVDVTAADLHIGHAVNLWMYRRLQEMGHKIIFLIGDFTTQIGDPSGRNKQRPIIPPAEIKKNAKEFIRQAKMVLLDNRKVLEIRHNSEWYNKMSAKELLSLMSMVTNDRLLARDMFRQRIKDGVEIYEHELIYPILQGYDSVMLEADLTIIGSDQLYNEMMGRFYQEKFGQSPQVIMTSKITPGIDGKAKQSKSIGNYIGLMHSPREKFGRVMSMPDELIIQYFKIYTDRPLSEIDKMAKQVDNDPMQYKLKLAEAIVGRYHGEKVAQQERDWFQKTFSQQQTPKNIPVIQMGQTSATVYDIVRSCFDQADKSNSDIRRLIEQKAVKVAGQAKTDGEETIQIDSTGLEIKVGKRHWFKVLPK